MTRDSYNAVTLTAGFTIFGSGLTIQSGFSDDMSVVYKTGTADADHWFCGTTDPPTDSSLIWNGINT